MNKPLIYAFDFDGVICDSAIETGITGWKVACQIWPEMPTKTPSNMLDLFRQVRPVMETGYEAILIMRLLFEGVTAQTLLDNFNGSLDAIIERDQITPDQLKKQFGDTRDHWIKHDLPEWLEMNPLFDGIANKLQHIDPAHCVIITTKQERFVDQILSANNVSLPSEQIFGLDRKLSKQQILSDFLASHPDYNILFVEDRLPTLLNVIDDNRLKNVQLFFADWGYNTQQDKHAALQLATVSTIDLGQMLTL